jgi:hypothetical protein
MIALLHLLVTATENASTLRRLVQSAKDSQERSYAVIRGRAIAIGTDVGAVNDNPTEALSNPDDFDPGSVSAVNDFNRRQVPPT